MRRQPSMLFASHQFFGQIRVSSPIRTSQLTVDGVIRSTLAMKTISIYTEVLVRATTAEWEKKAEPIGHIEKLENEMSQV